MLLRKTASLALLVFIFTLTTQMVEGKTSSKEPKPPLKKWAVIDGFRSAKFGMDKKKVTRSISRDFKISASKVKLKVHPTDKTTSIEITVPNLMDAGGTAKLGYILGQKSKKLMQVNVIWGTGVTKEVNPSDVVAAANLLRVHFLKKRYQEDKFAVNAKVNDNFLLVFRGIDQKGRMVALTLHTATAKEGEDKLEASKKVQLRLEYKLDPISPDVLSIKEGAF
jgi:hypothetical protein